MTQNNELEAVKRKIRALSEKTVKNGCTEQEVIFAAEKIGELLNTFNLTMSEVTLKQEKCVTDKFDTGSKHRGIAFNAMGGISRFCQTECWYSRPRKWREKDMNSGISLNFFGLESDVQMAIYLCRLISEAGNSALENFKNSEMYLSAPKGSRRNLTFSFYRGMGDRLYTRLCEMAREREEAEKKAAEFHAEHNKDRMIDANDGAKAEFSKMTTGTKLMCLEKVKFVENEFKKHGVKLSFRKLSSRANNFNAHIAGRKAGDNVNLQRPLANNGYGGNLLLT